MVVHGPILVPDGPALVRTHARANLRPPVPCAVVGGAVDLEVEDAGAEYRKRRRPEYDRVLEYAKICRVAKVMRPYLEASL